VDPSGLKYDGMGTQLWYKNLDITVEELAGALKPADILVDYSGGTGLLAGRILKRIPSVAVIIADVAPRFLRVALEKFRHEDRIALRYLHPAAREGHFAPLDEVLKPLPAAEVDALVCTNAVHLFPDLGDTFAAWHRSLRPGASVFIQSGNIRNRKGKPGELLITDVVEKIRAKAKEITLREPRYAEYRAKLEDPVKGPAYEARWKDVFFPLRWVEDYLKALEQAGFKVEQERAETVPVGAKDWYEACLVYPDLIAWVAGSPKVDPTPPSPTAQKDLAALLDQAFDEVFAGRATFDSTWTFITARR
jgi:ubiquinone/menaquinone biosynthesis C-methylase UbiE